MNKQRSDRHALGKKKDLLERRDVLKKTIGTSGLLASAVWNKPIVESVMLPAHAQTSEPQQDSDDDRDPPAEPLCPESISASLTARLETIPPTTPEALSCDDTETTKTFESGVTGQSFTIENDTEPAWSAEGDIFRLVLTNMSADLGEAAVDVTRSISFSNFDGDAGHPSLTQTVAVGSPPGDETEMADGNGLVNFSDTAITIGNVSGSADWSVEVVVSFTSECGTTEIAFEIRLNESFRPVCS